MNEKSTKDLLHDRTSDTIVRLVIALARRVAIRVVAEGVEDETTLTALETLGCDETQEFLIAEPDDADRITRFLDHPGTGRALPPRGPGDRRD